MSKDMIITAKDIMKAYRRNRVMALRSVSMDVNEGEIFGLIGPDGAGKTTLFRILTTLIRPNSGSATVDGLDIRRDYRCIRRRIGYMPGRFSLYQDLSIEENLQFFASVFGTTISENYALVKDIYSQIERFKDRKAGKLSGGMKQKLALSCALIHAPRVLFLDEPTTGVDPVSRKEFWEMLKKLQRDHGITIIASTPYMDEAMQCDRIALMQNGEFLRTDTPAGIISGYRGTLWSVSSNRMHALLADLRAWRHTLSVFSFGRTYHLSVAPEASFSDLNEYLLRLGHADIEIEEIPAGIEDCFMALGKAPL